MAKFQQTYPQVARLLQAKKQQLPDKKSQGMSHWLILAAMATMTMTSLPHLFALIAALIVIVGIFRGPGMLLAGILYSFLVSFFPPLAIFLGGLFFFLSLWQLQKTWRFNLFAAAFYGYPLLLATLHQLNLFNSSWQVYLTCAVGILATHLSLQKLYLNGFDSRSLALALVKAPFDGLLALLPHRVKTKLAPNFATAKDLAFEKRAATGKKVSPIYSRLNKGKLKKVR